MPTIGTTKYTDDELFAFCTAVEARHELLFNNGAGPDYKKDIESDWNAVAVDCGAQGFTRFSGRSTRELRDNIWSKKKVATMRKYDESKRTGSGKTHFKKV